MPTYEYRCDACGHDLEEFQSITAKPLRKCPKCGKPRLKRLIGTGAGIIFRGSGFYETDYRSDSYKQAAKAEKDKSGGTATATADKGESKADAKADAAPAAKPATPAAKPASAAKSKAPAGT